MHSGLQICSLEGCASKSVHVFQEERQCVRGLDWGDLVRERVLTRLQSVCVCFMCISEGVCQCMYMLGLDVVCMGGVRQGETVQMRVRSVPGSVWMDVWGEGRLHSGAAVSARWRQRQPADHARDFQFSAGRELPPAAG